MATDFDNILVTLQAEHERQVYNLQAEVDRLKKRVGKTQFAVSISANEDLGVQTADDHAVRNDPSVTTLNTSGALSVMPGENEPNSSVSVPVKTQPISKVLSVSPGAEPVQQASAHRKSGHATTKSMHILRIVARPHAQLSDIANAVRWSDLEWWKTFCESPEFDVAVSIVIVINTLIMAIDIQFDGITYGWEMNYPEYSSPGSDVWPGAEDFFFAAERVFIAVYSAELVFKFTILRCGFFRKVWNWLDLVVVVSGLLDVFLSGLTIDPDTLRILRLCKLARGIKALRLGKFCDALQLLVSSIAASCSTLFWALLVLIMFQCIAAMVINQMLTGYFEDRDLEGVDKHVVFRYFGTFSRSLLTMFEVVLGNWASPVRQITPHVGELYGAALLIYRCTCGFSVLNVVSAVFIQQTMKLMTSQTDIMLMEKRRAEKEFRTKLETLLRLAGIPEDKTVSWSELEAKLHTPDVKRLCFTLGLDHFDLEDIFHLLHRQGGMTREEFLAAALKIRKEARTIDVARLLVHSRKMRTQLEDIRESISHVNNHLTKMELADACPLINTPGCLRHTSVEI